MLMRIRIIEDTLPQGVCGYWHDASRTIWLHDKLNSRQRLCTLQHELIHAGHHDPGCGIIGAKAERRTRKETALWLVDPVEYATAECLYDGDSYLIACELGVTVQVVEDYKSLLADHAALAYGEGVME